MTDLQRSGRCACGRDIPIHVSKQILLIVARQHLPLSTVVLTYGCRRCGIVSVTLGQLSPLKRAA